MIERSAEIEQVLREIIDAMARSELDTVAQYTSREDCVVGIGSDAGEWTEGHDEFMTLMRASVPDGELHMRATLDDVKGFREADVGWAAGRGSFAVGDQRVGVRLTAVLHRETGDWKVVQTHASIGVPNTRMFDPLLQPDAGQS
jgi:ketosteroid isomerase-like protein